MKRFVVMKKVIVKLGLFFVLSMPIFASTDWTIQSGDNYIENTDLYDTVWLNNNANLYVLGGQTSTIYTNHNSTLSLTDGIVYNIEMRGSSSCSFYDGFTNRVYCYESSTLNVYDWSNSQPFGGSFHIVAFGNSIVSLFQGNSLGQVNAYDNSQLNIFGKNLIFSNGYIRGTWANGTDFSLYMRGQFDFPQQLILHEIPEPMTLALLALGGLLIRRK